MLQRPFSRVVCVLVLGTLLGGCLADPPLEIAVRWDTATEILAADPTTFVARGVAGRGLASWDFGDGTQAQGTEVVHVYDAPGLYDVSLTAGGLSDQARIGVNAREAWEGTAPQRLPGVAPGAADVRRVENHGRPDRFVANASADVAPFTTLFIEILQDGERQAIAGGPGAAEAVVGEPSESPFEIRVWVEGGQQVTYRGAFHMRFDGESIYTFR